VKKLFIVAGMLLLAGGAWAHLPAGVVFPAVQFPDANVPTVDGTLVEWDVVPTGYWITHEMLTETVMGVGSAWNAKDMALRAIIGFNVNTNKLYVMEDRFDDAIYTRTGWEPMEMEFDADHSGGIFNVWSDVTDQVQKDRLHGAQAQDYGWNQGGPGLNAWMKGQWPTNPPYGQFASTQSAAEGGEGFFRSEYMFTGFDDLDWNGPATSTIHQLREGDIIGFNMTVIDDDDLAAAGYEGYWTLCGATDSYYNADLLSDFLLSPVDPDIKWSSQQTAVEGQSWGQIKATFTE